MKLQLLLIVCLDIQVFIKAPTCAAENMCMSCSSAYENKCLACFNWSIGSHGPRLLSNTSDQSVVDCKTLMNGKGISENLDV